MRVTFLAHSGFLVELSDAALLFDFWQETLPPLPRGKPLLVFVSHGHEDHFAPRRIFPLDDGSREIVYLLGKGISLGAGSRRRWALPQDTAAKCRIVRGGEVLEPLPGLSVETLRSTDAGVAYLVTAGGIALFHAGDLNWWHWEGEPPADNAGMAANFRRFLSPLRGRRIDLALFPLDGRLQAAEGWGLRALLETADVRAVIPMHQWGDFSPTARFLAANPQWQDTLLPVAAEGQCWEFP